MIHFKLPHKSIKHSSSYSSLSNLFAFRCFESLISINFSTGILDCSLFPNRDWLTFVNDSDKDENELDELNCSLIYFKIYKYSLEISQIQSFQARRQRIFNSYFIYMNLNEIVQQLEVDKVSYYSNLITNFLDIFGVKSYF